MIFKTCTDCKRRLPATDEYFYNKGVKYVDTNNWIYSSKCKVCQQVYNSRYLDKKKRKMYEIKYNKDGKYPPYPKFNFSNENWLHALKFFNFKCAYCGASGRIEMEHIIPTVKGGGYTPDNIIPACSSCNSKKGNFEWDTWFKNSSIYSEERYWRIKEYICNMKDEEVVEGL